MSKKTSIGFATQKEARAAIRAIVNQYGLEQEFFDPLLQRLFVEQPYWQEPPGPAFTKFKWIKYTLPNGATTERWFTAYLPGGGWQGVSFNKAINRDYFDLDKILAIMARDVVTPIVSAYRDAHPFCEHCEDDFPERTAHVHHTIEMRYIIKQAIELLSDAERLEITESYRNGRGTIQQFRLSDEHKFVRYILDAHKCLDLLVALCRRHHNDAHGKETHT